TAERCELSSQGGSKRRDDGQADVLPAMLGSGRSRFMNRRKLVLLLGAVSLGGTAMLWRTLASLWRPGSAERTAPTMAAVADVMFPGTDGLPAASALGLHDRVLAMPEFQALIRRGVAWLDQYAASRGVADFLALDERGRL